MMLFILLFSLLDWLRGRSSDITNPATNAITKFLEKYDYGKPFTSKLGVSFVGGGVVALCTVLSSSSMVYATFIFLIVFLGLWLGYGLGWGKYFAAFHGKYNLLEKEFILSDMVGDYVYRKTGNAYLAGSTGMSVRHILFYPMFIGLGLVTGSYWPYLIGLGVLAGGLVYGAMRYIPEKYALATAEAFRGGLIGLLLWMSA